MNLLSTRNPEEDVRIQINNKFRPLITKLIDLYLHKLNNPAKALSLLELYNGIIFRFNLEYLKSADLSLARERLEKLSSRMYLEDSDHEVHDNVDTRKSFTFVDNKVAAEYQQSYQNYFKIIKELKISLESYEEYNSAVKGLSESLIRPEDAILEFIQEETICGVFVLQSGTIKFVSLELDKYSTLIAEFDNEIAAILRNGNYRDSENSVSQILSNLSKICLDDIFTKMSIPPDISIRIVPAGIFHSLPFHALFINDNRLVDVANISYSHGVTFFNDSISTQCNYLLVGNPEFNDQFRALDGAEEEIVTIQQYLPKSSTNVLTREKATKFTFMNTLKPATNLHLACHAQFHDDYPMASMFNLYTENDQPNNVSAGEIVSLDLKGCKFVYLSACDSGKGKILTGNEVMGIPRGFFMAGACNVICTMWPIMDEYAKDIACSFYDELSRTGKIVPSFNKAYRKAIADDVPLFAWAPFKVLTMERIY